jgi:hypothetical protein
MSTIAAVLPGALRRITTGKPEKAMESLREAVRNGFRDVAQIRGDEDRASLHDVAVYKESFKGLEDGSVSASR